MKRRFKSVTREERLGRYIKTSMRFLQLVCVVPSIALISYATCFYCHIYPDVPSARACNESSDCNVALSPDGAQQCASTSDTLTCHYEPGPGFLAHINAVVMPCDDGLCDLSNAEITGTIVLANDHDCMSDDGCLSGG
jgi:hypothetical protein